jgi:hypothetical protein
MSVAIWLIDTRKFHFLAHLKGVPYRAERCVRRRYDICDEVRTIGPTLRVAI